MLHWLHWLPVLVVVGLLLNGVRLRGRLRRLDTLPASGRPVDRTHEFVAAKGVRLTDAARRSASYHASRERLDVLDLVPADLTIERALDLARMVDTRTYRADRLAAGRGAFQALLVRSEVLVRAQVEPREDYDPIDLVEITERLKRCAPASTDTAVLPGLRAARDDGATRVRVQKRAYVTRPQNMVFPTLRDVITAVGFNLNKPWGLAAMALFWCQPFFVCAGRVPVSPRDLIRSPVVRITAGIEFVVSSVRAGRRKSRTAAAAKAAGLPADPAKEASKAAAARRRARYQDEIRAGVDWLLTAPRPDCPWCGSVDLDIRLRSRDLELRKPGYFQLDECLTCGHVFANPRLTLDGVEFYERDRTDGLNAERYEAQQVAKAAVLRSRAQCVRPFTAPRAWLDVGAARGHFCNAARSVWPRTAFDAVGPGEDVEEASRRSWVDKAYRGHFTDLAASFSGQYDVISMFEYLERSLDPSDELDAAGKALGPGGHLVVEMPNARGAAARRLGRCWGGWLVPTNQHFIPADNLIAGLEDRGMRTVLVQFGEVQRWGDGLAAVRLLTQAVAPSPTLPWLPGGAHPGRWLIRGLTLLAVLPLTVLAAVTDAITTPFLRRGTRSNAYRLIARKES